MIVGRRVNNYGKNNSDEEGEKNVCKENKVKRGRKERRIRFCSHYDDDDDDDDTGVNVSKHEINGRRRRDEEDEEEDKDRRKSRRRSPTCFCLNPN